MFYLIPNWHGRLLRHTQLSRLRVFECEICASLLPLNAKSAVLHTHTHQQRRRLHCFHSSEEASKKKMKIRLAGLYEPLVQMGFVITFFMFIHEHCRATTGGLCRGVCRFAVVTLVAFAPATGTTGGNRERHCTRVQFNGASRSYLSDHPNTHAMCLCMSLNCHFECM